MFGLKSFCTVNHVHISRLFDVCKVKVTCRTVARCQCFGHSCKPNTTLSWPFLGSFCKRTAFNKIKSNSLTERHFVLLKCNQQKSDVSGQRLKLSPKTSKPAVPKVKPKVSDIKRLLSLAKPESRKIAGSWYFVVIVVS